jgi:hypothetical protein
MEAGFGIGKLCKVLCSDAIWRLNYHEPLLTLRVVQQLGQAEQLWFEGGFGGEVLGGGRAFRRPCDGIEIHFLLKVKQPNKYQGNLCHHLLLIG